jgi:hypothetical protein
VEFWEIVFRVVIHRSNAPSALLTRIAQQTPRKLSVRESTRIRFAGKEISREGKRSPSFWDMILQTVQVRLMPGTRALEDFVPAF